MEIQHNLFQFSFILITCTIIQTVYGVSDKLWETVNRNSQSESVVGTVKAHLKEVFRLTPVHIIVDLKVDAITLSTILEEYMKKRAIYLWNNNELLSKNVESCATTQRIVGIYSNINHVKPSDQRKFFNKIWTTRAKYVVWVLGIVMKPIIQKVLENYWSLDCLKVTILITNFKSSQTTRFTYNPFTMGAFKRGELIELSTTDKFFPSKTKNLYGYEIIISLYDATPHVRLFNYTSLEGAKGGEVEALRYLSSWMNFTIILKSSPHPLSSYTQFIFNKTYYGSIGPVGDIINGYSDVLGNSHLFVTASDLKLDFVYPLKNVQLQIAVPLEAESSGIGKIFRYVNPLSQVLIFIAVGLFSLYVFIVHKRNFLIVYFQLLFQMNIRSISDRMSERIFMFSWLIFAFFIAIAQEIYIVKSMTDLTISQSIKSMQDIHRTNLKIVLDQTNFKGLKSLRNSTNFDRRIEINPNFVRCLSRLVKGERVACVGTEPIVTSGIDNLKKRLIANKEKIIKQPYIIKTPVFSMSTLIVKKGFPYLHQFNKGEFKMYSFGLIHKWRKEEHVGKFKEMKEFEGPLCLLHFHGVFGFFALCIILANMVFIGEIIFHLIKKKKVEIVRTNTQSIT